MKSKPALPIQLIMSSHSTRLQRPADAASARRPFFAVALPGLLGVLLAGCGTIPDLQPFADSTSQVASAVRSSGKLAVTDARTLVTAYAADARDARRVAGEVSDKERPAKVSEAEGLEQSASRLKERTGALELSWASNVRMIDAIVAYSDSLASIAAAGKKGQESAAATGAALKNLLSSFDAAVPIVGAVAEVAPIAAKLYGQVAATLAAKSLEKAVIEAQPAIDDAARVLTANLGNLAAINHALFRELPAVLQDPARAGFDARSERGVLKAAIAAHDELRTEINTAIRNAADSAGREVALQPLSVRTRQLEAIIAASQAKLAPVDQKIAAERARGALQAQFIVAAQSAVAEWAVYHRRLGGALQERKIPSVDSLKATANDLRELVTVIRKNL